MKQNCRKCNNSTLKGKCSCGRPIYLCGKYDNCFTTLIYEKNCKFYEVED